MATKGGGEANDRLSEHTTVKGRENPWLLRMKVDALHPLAAGIELALCLEKS